MRYPYLINKIPRRKAARNLVCLRQIKSLYAYGGLKINIMSDLKKTIHMTKIFICLCLLILSASIVYGEEKNEDILVIGSGAIIRENIAEARKLAISDAHVKGIEAYLEKILGTQGMLNNFENIVNEIIPGSADVIENFQVLAEDDSSKSYKILVSIKVNEKLMEEKLRNSGIILYEGVPLRVLFLVSDGTKQDESPFIWWDDPENKTNLSSSELLLIRLFQERGFNPVNRLTSMPENGYNPELFKDDLSDEDAAQWGKLYSADVVILGKVDVSEFNTLIVHMKAIQVENTSVISSFTHDQTIESESEEAGTGMEVQEKILGDGVSQMVPDILKAFKKEEEKQSRFDIELKGLDSLKQVMAFISFLREKISGVDSVLETRIARGTITISVEFSGNRKTFIEKIKSSTEVPFASEIRVDETGVLTVTAM